jgi:hypothetical protein
VAVIPEHGVVKRAARSHYGRRATLVFGQLARHGSRIAATASGTTTAATIADRSLVR